MFKFRLTTVLLFVCFVYTTIMTQTSQFVTIADGVLHYRSFGKGAPVVIINGGPGMNSEGFAGLAEALSLKGYRCVLFDQRGTGKSKINNVDETHITMKKMTDDLEILRKHLNIKKWSVFGQSFGGLLAAQYAYSYPKTIEKLIFSNSGGLDLHFLNYVGGRISTNISDSERDSLSYFEKKLAGDGQNKEYLNGRARQLASAYVFNKKFIPVIAERLLQANFEINRLVYADLQKNKFDYKNRFAGHSYPVLIFQGKNDIISQETAKTIQSSFKNSKLILLENCAHYPWLDQEEKFWKEIELFLSLNS